MYTARALVLGAVLLGGLSGGSLSDGSLGSGALSHGALGTAPSGDDPLASALELAFVRYDAEQSPGTDDTQATSWENIGSAGSAWDADSAISGGLTWQQGGDCTWGTKPCYTSDATGADQLQMSAAQSETWTAAQYHCVVVHLPGTGIVRVVDASQAGNPSRNMWGTNGEEIQYIANASAAQAVADRDAQLLAMCLDMSTPSAAKHALNGGSISTSDISGTLYRDIEQIALGGRFDGSLACANCEIHTFVAWNVDPGHDVQEMSQLLYDYWNN